MKVRRLTAVMMLFTITLVVLIVLFLVFAHDAGVI